MSFTNRSLNTSFEVIERLGPAAVQKWGIRAQQIKAIEELAELQVQVCKLINGSPTTPEAVADEIADVLIVAAQLRIQGDLRSIVDERLFYKLQRLDTAIRREFERAST